MWFLTLFVVLPFFAKTQDEAGEVVPGTPGSAPHQFSFLKLFCVNTVVAVAAFGGVYVAALFI
jgi:predicted secreted protein